MTITRSVNNIALIKTRLQHEASKREDTGDYIPFSLTLTTHKDP